MKWAIQAKEEEKNKPQTFRADGWTGNQRSSQIWWRNEQELLCLEPRTARKQVSWMARAGREWGDKGPKAFCPGWRHQPGQKGGLLFRLAPTGTKLLGPLIPFPLPPPEPFSSLVSYYFWLGREFLLISSPHLWRSLIPRPSIGAKGLGFVFLFFLGLYSSFHALEIEKMCS